MKAKEITVTYKFNLERYNMVEIGGVFTLEDGEKACQQIKEVFKGLKALEPKIKQMYEEGGDVQ